MELSQELNRIMASKAQGIRVTHLCLGLGYTSVVLSDTSVGVAYTYFDRKTGCTLMDDYLDAEGRPASEVLELIRSANPLARSMALALINALCQPDLHGLPPDKDNAVLFKTLGIDSNSRVAMVGLFKPLVKLLESKGALVEVIDEFRGLGNQKQFYDKLANWADAALVTSTSILNNTFEEIMAHVGKATPAALLGPSTPMAAEAFSAWPAIRALAGTLPLDTEAVLKGVRHGLGTPYLHKHSRKITLVLPDHSVG